MKQQKYAKVIRVIEELVQRESDMIARMANVSALLKEEFGFWWVGFYRVIGDELILGPFQGPLACMCIKYGRGVCGTSWKEQRTIAVDDVEQFPGHIACSSASKSEIVVPLISQDKVIAVLDIDSEHLAHFDTTDAQNLTHIASLLTSPASD